MRRIWTAVLAVLLLVSLCVPVFAQTGAKQVNAQATVAADESCTVSLSVTFRLEEAVQDLTFPLPTDARSIMLNGSRVGSTVSDAARHVDLSRIVGSMAGEFSVTITYQLPDVIESGAPGGTPQLRLPLLSGFAYPVEKLSFTVALPGDITAKPAFSSGYHQANIEQDLLFSYRGNTVTGSSLKELKDHETLVMTLPVTEELFPQTVIQLHNLEPYYLAMGVCAVLALLYWLIFLRAVPPRFFTTPVPPEGYSAGQLGTLIRLQGTDLIAMIFSWAQLGYLTIQHQRGRVLLHKRMEMGNERSVFEQKCFQQLFTRATVDTSGIRFAMLCQKLSAKAANLQELMHPRSGSKQVFRLLMALVGLFDGICLGLNLAAEAAVQWLPAALLAAACFGAAWQIQLWSEDLFSRRKSKLLLSLLLAVCWLLLSVWAGTWQTDAWLLVGLLLSGLMATFGGRRTEAGRQLMGDALGFRMYLATIPRTQLHHIRQQNPDYFHSVAPYAMALGCDKAFASRFGRDLLPPCPYITGVPQKPMTATEWCKLLRSTARSMESRLRQQPIEKLNAVIRALTK